MAGTEEITAADLTATKLHKQNSFSFEMPQAKAKRAKYPFMDFAPDFIRGLLVAF